MAGADYRMADYGIQKVVPGSREGLVGAGAGGSMPYSSAPQYNDGVQSIQIDQQNNAYLSAIGN